MKIQSFIVCVFIVICVKYCDAGKLPPYFKVCQLKNEKFQTCLKDAVQNAIISLKDGYAPLGIKSLDPMEVARMSVGQGTGKVDVKQDFSNVLIYGTTDLEVVDFMADMDKMELKFTTLNKNLTMDADYEVSGRLLMVPVQGKGKCNAQMFNMRMEHDIKLEKTTRKGKDYAHCSDYKLTYKPESVHFYFDNLFGGDKALGDSINSLVNENWEGIFDDVKGPYEEVFSMMYKSLVNAVFTRVPYKDIFN